MRYVGGCLDVLLHAGALNLNGLKPLLHELDHVSGAGVHFAGCASIRGYLLFNILGGHRNAHNFLRDLVGAGSQLPGGNGHLLQNRP
ncbi:hypothetical protein D3C73_1461560 [compost metagenome]